MSDIKCPDCGTDLTLNAYAILPDTTDLTITLDITSGQLVRAKTVAGVLENFAAMQVEVGKAMGCNTDVFVAGLSYENDRISITTRICNLRSDGEPEQAGLFDE